MKALNKEHIIKQRLKGEVGTACWAYILGAPVERALFLGALVGHSHAPFCHRRESLSHTLSTRTTLTVVVLLARTPPPPLFITPPPHSCAQVYRELGFLVKLSNPFICNCHYAFQDTKSLYLGAW